MNIISKILVLLFIYAVNTELFAQRNPASPPDIQDLIEDYITSIEGEGEFDFNALFEELEYYQKKPLNLNKATELDLQELGLLTDLEISSLLNYRRQLGDFIAIYELQSIPSFTEATIRRILPYVSVGGSLDDVQASLGKMLVSGKNDLLVRWATINEVRKSDQFFEDEGISDFPFLGDPNRSYIRFKHNYENRLTYGFTAEKDIGEEFFKGSNKQGFDFYSGHFFLKKYSKRLKALALGDFQVSMGQGLVLFSGFGRGKGSDVMKIRRNQIPIKGYTSVGETLFMRGGGVTLGITDQLEFSAFGSHRSKDANIIANDTLDLSEQELLFSSFQGSGLHRTASEIEDEGSIKQTSTGGILKYKADNFHVALNALYHQFDRSLERTDRPYSQFYFSGDRLLNVSLDYSYLHKNFNFFGETAMSDNGGLATLNGFQIGLDRKIDLALLHRYFQPNYQSIDANPFAESASGTNEQGLYVGMEIRPVRNLTLRAYYDMWRHPWLRFGVDAPSHGSEYLIRLTYKVKRKMETYIQFRSETKARNAKGDAVIDFLAEQERTYLRFHFASKLEKGIELRSRAEFSFFDDTVNPKANGYMVYQDLIFKPKFIPFSFTCRYALFNTDNYDTRIYAYENGILNDFFVPAYYNKGTRFYLNLRYTGIRNLSLELHYSRTYWDNRFAFINRVYHADGSVSEADFPTRTALKLQAKYKF